MPILRFCAKYLQWFNIKHLILAILVYMVVRDCVNDFASQTIAIKPENIKVTNRQTQKDLKKIADQETKILIEYEIYSHKTDSVVLVLDSISHRKRSRLRDLQKWFDKY